MDRVRCVLVTGASTGLGLSLAKRLIAQAKYRVVLTARSSSLPRFASEGISESEMVWLRGLDVTDESQRHAVVDEVKKNWGGVDVLVNNAGVSYRSVVEHVHEEERLAQMDINFRSPMDMIRLVLPKMRAQRWGRIINVSSVGGMMAMPTMATYSASKFALEGATEALWYEVRPWNVRVSLIQPGFIHSESFKNTRTTRDSRHSLHDALEPYHNHYEHMTPFIAKMMNLARATPDRIAKKIYQTIERKKPPLRVPATIDAHLFGLLRRLLPRQLYHEVLYLSLPKIKTWGNQ